VFKQKQEISISPNSGNYAITSLDTSKKVDGAAALSKKSNNESVPASSTQVIANAVNKNETAREKADFERTFDDSTKALNDKKINTPSSNAKPKPMRIILIN
jgi:hypothetical protein